MSNKTQIKGLDSLLKKLNSLGGDVETTVKKSMSKNIKLVKGEAKMLAPVDTGDLRKSIYSRTESNKSRVRGIVYTNSDHAGYMEFGTGQKGAASPSPPKDPDARISYKEDWVGVPAQPYMYPALKNNEKQVIKNIKSDIKAAIRKVAK